MQLSNLKTSFSSLSKVNLTVVLLSIALVAAVIASISLPLFDGVDVVRAHFNDIILSDLRFGIWAACRYDIKGKRTCTDGGHAYDATRVAADPAIGPSWVRGLAVLPVGTVAIGAALVLAVVPGAGTDLYASLTSCLAALLMFLAFVIDLALIGKVNSSYNSFSGVSKSTHAGAGFWLTLVSLLFLCGGAWTALMAHKRQNNGDIELGFMKRFKR
ncbi:hypothetical protein EXIGLDRAFT_838489 [Exidia glandulosa HHB12029]|uniref:Pali-domain-containing protein n=1 Tax=Exidia glandulosa HHB12029 TaxID=1314781 RepID=A0A165FSF9_EXIGL|nr:hypothetical protein EXIGLDRAFT_838489 [Exidia glandulosa HHB12029]